MKIGYFVPDLENPFWRMVLAGMEKEAKFEGATVEAFSSEHDEELQIKQISEYAAMKPSAVLVSPLEIRAIAPICKVIKEGGIPIVAVDQNMTTDVTASIISGNVRGGISAAMFLAERLLLGKRIVTFHSIDRLQNITMRRKSFTNEINRGSLRIVKQIKADGLRNRAYEEMKAFLAENSDFEGLFAENDDMALGAIDALKEKEVPHWPVIVGYDGIPEALEAIREGRMEATIAQDPESLGAKSIELVFKIIHHQRYEELVTVLPKLITIKELS